MMLIASAAYDGLLSCQVSLLNKSARMNQKETVRM